MIPNNVCPVRITAAAGTNLAGAYSGVDVISRRYPTLFIPPKSGLQPEGLLPARGVARSRFAHCRRFSTAATRRCPGSVSVPVWPVNLSVRLPVIALVSRYLTNKLIGHEPLHRRHRSTFLQTAMRPFGRIRYYPPFPVAIPLRRADCSWITHPFATLLAPEGTFAFDLHA